MFVVYKNTVKFDASTGVDLPYAYVPVASSRSNIVRFFTLNTINLKISIFNKRFMVFYASIEIENRNYLIINK